MEETPIQNLPKNRTMAYPVAVKWKYGDDEFVKALVFARIPLIGEIVDIGDDLYVVKRLVHLPGGDELREPSHNLRAIVKEAGKASQTTHPIYAVIWLSRPDESDPDDTPELSAEHSRSWPRAIGNIARIIMGK